MSNSRSENLQVKRLRDDRPIANSAPNDPNALDFLSQFQQRKKARKHAVIESRLENEQINVKGVGKYCLATQGKSSLVSIKRDDVTYKQRNNITFSSIRPPNEPRKLSIAHHEIF